MAALQGQQYNQPLILIPMLTPEEYDPPTYGGTPQQEAHLELTMLGGLSKPDHQWILTDFDVWERNPYYEGPPQPHPEDDHGFYE